MKQLFVWNLEIMGRVWKLLKRAHVYQDFFKIQLGINNSDKKTLLLENEKVNIQDSNAKLAQIRASLG